MPATSKAREAPRITEHAPSTLGLFTIITNETQFSYKLAALATVGTTTGMIAILSAVASQTAIKALRACLSKAAKAKFRAACEGFSPAWELEASSDGYRYYTNKLSFGMWQSLAVARLPGLMCQLSDASLWQKLQLESITTPLLPSWMPWLRAELQRREHLRPLHSFQCAGAVLNLTTEALDEIVSEGLRRKKLRI